jgi:dephospho-CoA kinase
MKKVALTGGIATGKSFVVQTLRERGVPCLDADDLAHGVMQAGTEATAAIAERFGRAVIAPDGEVDRKALGAIVFADAAARRDLEAIVHPAVRRAIQSGIRGFELLGERLVVIDIPLLYETERAKDYDAVIVTVCAPDTQLARLRGRGLSDEAARLRLAAQLPAEEKAARGDFVIRTDGTFEETRAQVEAVLAKLQA